MPSLDVFLKIIPVDGPIFHFVAVGVDGVDREVEELGYGLHIVAAQTHHGQNA